MMVILDESGSMGMIRDDTIGGFNEWLEANKEAPGEARLSLVKFDTEFRPLEVDVPIAHVLPLDATRYVPRGSTALYDAISRCVHRVEASVGKDDRALVVIITDGQENSSREVTRAEVEKLVKDREAKGNWTFTYLSASPDAFADSVSIGIGRNNTMTFTADAIGTQTALNTLRQATAAYRGGAMGQSASFYHNPDDTQDEAFEKRYGMTMGEAAQQLLTTPPTNITKKRLKKIK
jgi:hypothetical protein